MSETVILLMSAGLGISVLCSFVSGKYKSNIRALGSLVLVASVLSLLSDIKIGNLEYHEIENVSVAESSGNTEKDISNVLANIVRERIIEKFEAEVSDVVVNGYLDEGIYTVKDTVIKLSAECCLSDVLYFVENELNIPGKVSVVKIDRGVE